MDLFSEFEKRRGAGPPSPAHPAPTALQEEAEDVRQVLSLAFAGRLRHDCILPVLPPYRAIFGPSIWLCVDDDRAQRKQNADGILAFAPHELMDVVAMVAQDMQKAAGVVAAKRAFCGMIAK